MIPAVFTVGRFNPITRGHVVLFQKVFERAFQKNAKPLIFIIDAEKTSVDKNRNPLTGEQRLVILKKLYPKILVELVSNPVEALDVLDVMGLYPITWIAGSDRVSSYSKLLEFLEITTCEILEVSRDIGEYEVLVDADNFTALCTWKQQKGARRIDADALLASYPEAAAACTKTGDPVRKFLLK